MFKKSYKGRRIKFAAKKSLAVPVAIVTSFIVILAVSLLLQRLQQHQQRQNRQQI